MSETEKLAREVLALRESVAKEFHFDKAIVARNICADHAPTLARMVLVMREALADLGKYGEHAHWARSLYALTQCEKLPEVNMPKFKVLVAFEITGSREIEAEDEESAREKAAEMGVPDFHIDDEEFLECIECDLVEEEAQ